MKRLILIELNGLLIKDNGELNQNFIPPMRKEAKVFIEELSKEYEIKLFTTRNKTLTAMWVMTNGLKDYISDVTNIKESCWLFIDEKCICINGNFEKATKHFYFERR